MTECKVRFGVTTGCQYSTLNSELDATMFTKLSLEESQGNGEQIDTVFMVVSGGVIS